LGDRRLNALDLAAPAALYCGANGTIDGYDIGTDGQGTLAFTLTLDGLVTGEIGTGLGNRLYLLEGREAEIAALDLLSLYTFNFNPAVCMG
jgi:hypothetical protein